jgi:GTP cyclohydrolase I
MSDGQEQEDPIEGLVRAQLKELHEDPDRDGLLRTPHRVAKALRFLTAGYDQDPKQLLNGALFDVSYDEMVLVKDIDFFSLCEHHMLPFFGRAHVAYLPGKKIVGLSKIPRLVEMFSRRLQVQERLTTEIAETLESVLEPEGVGVVIEAIHLCMKMRGVEQQNAFAITSSMRGAFATDSKTRAEFMELIRHRKSSFA